MLLRFPTGLLCCRTASSLAISCCSPLGWGRGWCACAGGPGFAGFRRRSSAETGGPASWCLAYAGLLPGRGTQLFDAHEAAFQRSPRSFSEGYLLVWDLQELQDHGVRPHVPQQPLLLLPALPTREAFLDAQLAEPQQDLERKKEKEKERHVRG